MIYLEFGLYLNIEEPKRPKASYRDSPVYEQEEVTKDSPEPAPLPSLSPGYQVPPRVLVHKRDFHPVLTGNVVRDKLVDMIVDAFKKDVPPGNTCGISGTNCVVLLFFLFTF